MAHIGILRAQLPTPDAVIVRHGNGSYTVVADVTLPQSYLDQLVADIPHLGHPTHAV